RRGSAVRFAWNALVATRAEIHRKEVERGSLVPTTPTAQRLAIPRGGSAYPRPDPFWSNQPCAEQEAERRAGQHHHAERDDSRPAVWRLDDVWGVACLGRLWVVH